ncbi:MAG: UvrD-helicase domain-containing protein [Saprospiraceae bacterium]|nr:UvrD-helicase domain-containing protein [Saprospiraceae bacterium]
MNLKIISAGAGSGKTYSLTQEMVKLLSPDDKGRVEVRASGIIATTFTNKAAAELKERVRIELLENGLTKEADELGNAMIGTVHSIGVQLLKRFAFQAGVSPEVDIIADSDQQNIFNQSLSSVLSIELIQEMEQLSDQLGFAKNSYRKRDWRADLKAMTDIARANNFDIDVLEESKQYSLDTFFELLPNVSQKDAEYFDTELQQLIQNTLLALENNDDATKGKQTLVGTLKGYQNSLNNKGYLPWHQWAALTKLKATKKSRDDVFDLIEFAKSHNTHPAFHLQISMYVSNIFNAAIAALKEYEQYKKVRGLIDYIDMEVLILKLLEQDIVKEVLSEEIDLLLVDEFQDTNPLQLKIFLNLTDIANKSIWVGDPKQSIYGFRGADPTLMKAVMDSTDNISNLPYSWRSREDLVNLCNGLFVNAFEGEMPVERIALDTAEPFVKSKESTLLKPSTHHWHFQFEGRPPRKPWFEQCIARTVAEVLSENWMVRIKGSNDVREMHAGDIAILCRSNHSCQYVAEALHKEGIKASISRSGLLETAEVKLILAGLRYILNKHDALAVGELLILANKQQIEEVVTSRLEYLVNIQGENSDLSGWGNQVSYVQQLNNIRQKCKELSASEILNGIIEKLDIRRIVSAWSNRQQRLDNIDSLRKFASDYEETCKSLNSAATLGGFLLWLDDLARESADLQGTGAGKDAVNVMTYHKSKGLEWPFVVFHSLDNDLRDNIWGVRIVRKIPGIDIKNPLSNRLICYWVNPYSDQIKGTELMDTLVNHKAQQIVKKQSLDEESRLLYVGLTRARDYVVLPSMAKKNTKWLNRVFHKGDEISPVLDINKSDLPWLWNGKENFIKTQLFNYERIFPVNEVQEEDIDYLTPRIGEKSFDLVLIDSAKELFPNMSYKFANSLPFCKPYVLNEMDGYTYETLQLVFSTFILADNPEFSQKTRLKIANNLLFQFDLSEVVKSEDLFFYSSCFYKKIYKDFRVKLIEKHKYFRYSNDGIRQFNGVMDFVIYTEDNHVVIAKFLLIDNAELNKNKRKMNEEVSILEAAGRVIKEASNPEKILFLIINSLEGNWTPLIIKNTSVQSLLFK